MRVRPRLIHWSAYIWLCWMWTGAVSGQDVGPGKVGIQSRWDALRSHAPIALEAQLSWPLPSVQEGKLQIESYRDVTLLERWQSHPTLMSDVGQTLNVSFPYPLLNDDRQTYKLRAHFLGDDGRTIYLDEHVLLPYSQWRRVSVVGVVENRPSTIPAGMVSTMGDTNEFFQSVVLEPWFPSGRDEEETTLLRAWQRRTVHVPIPEVPAQPLELLSFDVLLVSSDQLVQLAPGQRDAILRWTLGGGSLGVSVTGNIPQDLSGWFNQLFLGKTVDPRVNISAAGDLRVLTSDVTKVHLTFPGVGRAAVITSSLDVNSPEWHRTVLHLWKIRPEQREYVLSRPAGTAFLFSHDEDWTNRDPYTLLPWEPAGETSAAQLTKLLLPSEVKGVPLWLVCSVLATCFVLVVPGDYLVLGTLKMRRWTWVVMPAIALACTWYMIQTANGYMGNQDHAQSLTIVDLDHEYQPVRWNQFELSFPATTKMQERTRQDVLETDLGEGQTDGSLGQPASVPDPDLVSDEVFMGAVLRANNLPSLNPTDIPQFNGTVPGDYVLHRKVNQWTARVSRLVSFEPLTGIDTEWLPNSAAEAPPEWADWLQLAEQHFSQSAIVIRQGKEAKRLTDSQQQLTDLQARSARFQAAANYVLGQSHRHERGMFRIVSEMSPLGLSITEDLALDSVPGYAVLITANADESQFIAWRFRLPQR